MGRLGRRLGKLEGVAQAVVPAQSRRDLSVFDDDELEELAGLAQKAEEANRAGAAVIWSEAEAAALARLSAKIQRE